MTARSKSAVQTAIRTKSALFARNRQDLTRVLVSYRTFSQRWAFRPVQKLSGLFVMSVVAVLAGTVGSWLARKARLIAWQERLTGAVMIGLGVLLLF